MPYNFWLEDGHDSIGTEVNNFYHLSLTFIWLELDFFIVCYICRYQRLDSSSTLVFVSSLHIGSAPCSPFSCNAL